MAKQKTKKCVMDVTATEIQNSKEHGQQTWEFAEGQYVWRFKPGKLGLNLSVVKNDTGREFEPVLYAKTLDHAVMFACGHAAGVQIGQEVAKNQFQNEWLKSEHPASGDHPDNQAPAGGKDGEDFHTSTFPEDVTPHNPIRNHGGDLTTAGNSEGV